MCYSFGMKEILITGASEGIGLALAHTYCAADVHLHLVARNVEKLKQAKGQLEQEGCRVSIHPCDLTNAEQLHALQQQIPYVDVCILNAGVGYTGAVVESEEAQNLQMVQLNVTSLMVLADFYVKAMVQRHNGQLILMSSTGCFQPGPYIALYYATKAFVTSYGRALQEEVKGSGVHVCVVCPGPVRTDFYEKSGVRAPIYAANPYQVAHEIYHKAEKKTVLVIGRMNRILRFVPTGLKMKWIAKQKRNQRNQSRT